MIKKAKTNYPVTELISKRWSARSFSEKQISTDELNTIFEAASWAASANNEQPWQYLYAYKGTEGFQKLWECLMAGNQPWTKNASVFIVTLTRKTYESNQKPNVWAAHDLGMANAHILLQAISMDIYCHIMAGLDKNKLNDTLQLDENLEAHCIIALGYLDHHEKLEEPYKTREITPRKRKPLNEFIKEF